MLRISHLIEKLENKVDRKIGKFLNKNKEKLWQYGTVGGLCLYFYAMLVNSIRLGIHSTFSSAGSEQIDSIIEWNPLKNLLALFSSTGMGVTFIIVLMTLLISKKGYNFLSGYHFTKDKRGFDVLQDGTHGTSGFMIRKEMEIILDIGEVSKMNGTILGKLKDDPEDDDRYAEYLTPKTTNGLNEHIMVFGASGAGKSRGFVKPFILQCAKRKESLVLVDPKGEFFETMSGYLQNEGYEVKAFNLLDMDNSNGWNIMADIDTDKNLVQSMAEVIIRNTSNANERQDFWEKAEMNLFMALIHYVQRLTIPGTNNSLPIEQRSLGAIYKMLSSDTFATIEEIMSQLPNSHPAKAPYGIFRLANRQIWGNIAIGLGNRLGVFQNELVDKITKYNEIDLELPGKKPCAYFCIISDQDSSLEFLSSLFFSTLFARLTNYARRHGENGRLPIKVNVCLDEFCNIGKILDFKKIISTVRSRGINCQVIIQSAAQLSDRYEKKEWEEIVGNCDTALFLGCNDTMTAEYISGKCGMATIKTTNDSMPLTPLFSPVINSTKPYSQTKSNTQRALMLPDEVLRLPNNQCLVLLRGQKPLQLYKIIPDELPSFKKLTPVKISEFLPDWKKRENEKNCTKRSKTILESQKKQGVVIEKTAIQENSMNETFVMPKPMDHKTEDDKKSNLPSTDMMENTKPVNQRNGLVKKDVDPSIMDSEIPNLCAVEVLPSEIIEVNMRRKSVESRTDKRTP